MKYLLILLVCLGMTGCLADVYVGAPVARSYPTGTVEFCDDYGCRMVTAPYYYLNGELVYWDVHFGCWIGSHGYHRNGVWYHGPVPGYHTWYHPEAYHHFGVGHGPGIRGTFHGGHNGGHR